MDRETGMLKAPVAPVTSLLSNATSYGVVEATGGSQNLSIDSMPQPLGRRNTYGRATGPFSNQ